MTPGSTELLRLPRDKTIPRQIVRNVAELGHVVSKISKEWKNDWLQFKIAPGGERVLIYASHYDFPDPTGVWIWPAWRNTSTYIVFRNFSNASFVSSDHVLLEEWIVDHVTTDNEVVGHWNRLVVDLRGTAKNFMSPQCRPFAVDKCNNWYAIDANRRIRCGQLDNPVNENGRILIDMPVTSASILHDSSILAISTANGTVETYSLKDAKLLRRISTTVTDSQIINGGFVSQVNNRLVCLRINPSGDIVSYEPVWLNDTGNERIFLTSPDGQWALTWSDTWYGGLKVKLRPLADDVNARPKIPPMPSFPAGFLLGWLVWQNCQ
jgi:hypothetical protein